MISNQEKPEELIRAEAVIDDGKFDEALNILKEFEEKHENSTRDIVLSHLIKTDLLLQKGLNQESFKLAEQTYEESLNLGKNLLSVDALVFMAESSIRLSRYEDAHKFNTQGEDLLNDFPEKLTSNFKRREASILFTKGKIGFYVGEPDQTIEYLEHSLLLREKNSSKREIAVTLSGLAFMFLQFKGDLEKSLEYAKQSLIIAKESKNRYEIGFSHLTLGVIYSKIGDLERSIINNEQSLAIYTEFDNKRMKAVVLNNIVDVYKKVGDLDRAIESLEESLVLRKEGGNLRDIAEVHDFIIQILIEKGELGRAKQLLDDLEKLNEQLKDKRVNVWILFSKALLLKANPRARNRVKAEEIFKHILEEKVFNFEYYVGALLNLCELLLIELRTINDVELLEEIESYINQLLDIAEKSQSYWILCETYLLQAKLSLLTFDIRKAQRFLTQAHQIAERFQLDQLLSKIDKEKEDLGNKLDLWEKLKDAGAPMVERFELARLDEQISGMVRNRAVMTTQITEDEVMIHKEKKICLVCRGEVLRFTYICDCGVIYCGNCAQALTDLENVCWSCEIPIDYSKPVKQIEEEPREINFDKKYK